MPTIFAPFEDRLLAVDLAGGGWRAEPILEWYDFEAVAVDPNAPETVFAGTFDDGLLRSTDGGDSWEQVDDENLARASVTAVASDPSNPDRFYVGTEPSRVYRTTDGGETWEALEGLTDLPSASGWAFPPRPSTHHVRWIEVDPTDPGHLYVSIEAGALVQSHDGGETWEDRVPGARMDNHELTTHPDAPGHAWSAAGDGFAETTDGGESWAYPQDGLRHRYCWSVAVDPADPDRLLLSAATGPGTAHSSTRAQAYVYRRSGDSEWTLAGDGLPDGDGLLRPVLARGAGAGTVYLSSNRGLYLTESMGDRWTRIDVEWPDALTEQTPRGIAVLP